MAHKRLDIVFDDIFIIIQIIYFIKIFNKISYAGFVHNGCLSSFYTTNMESIFLKY